MSAAAGTSPAPAPPVSSAPQAEVQGAAATLLSESRRVSTSDIQLVQACSFSLIYLMLLYLFQL